MEGLLAIALMVALLYVAVKLPSDRKLGEWSRNRRGQKAYDRGDYATTLFEWEILATQGNAEAQYNLGNMYAEGKGVSQDIVKTYELFSLAIAQGHEFASIRRERLSERMSPDQITQAQFSLGLMYHDGDSMYGVSQDFFESAKWFHLAAGGGYAPAQFYLGQMYYNGEGVSQDYEQAAKWYRLAAEAGHTDAQSNLGLMYRKGRGVAQDYAESVKWFLRAVEAGILQNYRGS